MTPFWSATLGLFAAGLVGFLLLAVTTGSDLLDRLPIKNRFLRRVVLVIQPAVLLLLLAAAGTLTTDQAGTRSIIAQWAAGYDLGNEDTSGFVLAAIIGLVFGFGIFLIDSQTRSWWSPDGRGPDAVKDWKPSQLLLGVTYGGVTEEIMMRWGIMNILMWALGGLTGAVPGTSSTFVVWVAIIGSALIFAAGHLPAARASGYSSSRFTQRTLALNFVAGLLFGILFWRWNLETAMIAHAAFHVGAAIYVVGARLFVPAQPPETKKPPGRAASKKR
jgi:hypothetical protein